MIRTNVVLDNQILDKAKHLTGITTTKNLLHYANLEIIRHKRQKDLLKLKGSISWEGNLAHSRLGRIY